MAEYRFTEYFEKEVLRKRSYLKKEWCTRVLDNPIRSEPQEGNRSRVGINLLGRGRQARSGRRRPLSKT